MNFTEIIFLLFFGVIFTSFSLARRRPLVQVWILLIGSYAFYAWWRLDYLVLILFSSLVDYLIGAALPSCKSKTVRRSLLSLSLAANLGLLGFFKYYDWLAGKLNLVLPYLDAPRIPLLDLLLPVGISFYTFQSMSYTIDIYRGDLKPCRSLPRFLLFVAAFPQLVAGPIVRAKQFIPQLYANLAAKSDASGLWLILYGLLKKMLLADPLGMILVDPVFTDFGRYSALDLTLAAYGFGFQIFLDFSAYSDIAIGLGRLFGLELPINFRSPYLATNPQELWRRWHITLSTWLRDYLYIPLGGGRGGRAVVLRNLMITMLLGGLWHGAGGTFIVWGGLHGLYLCLFHWLKPALDQGRLPWLTAWPRWIKILFFFQFVSLAWIFFRSPSLGSSLAYLVHLARADWSVANVQPVWLGLLAGAVAVHYLLEPGLTRVVTWANRMPALINAGAFMAFFGLVYFLSEHRLIHQAFIYFQF